MSRAGRLSISFSLAAVVGVVALVGAACDRKAAAGKTPPAPSGSAAPTASAGPGKISALAVDHGELDTQAPEDAPRLAATQIATTIYERPDIDSRKLGYIRLGGIVKRSKDSVKGKGCEQE